MDRGEPRRVRIRLRKNRARIVNALIKMGLLRLDSASAPRFTILTEHGRYVLAVMIGYFADALVASSGAEIAPIEHVEWRKALAKVAKDYPGSNVDEILDPPSYLPAS